MIQIGKCCRIAQNVTLLAQTYETIPNLTNAQAQMKVSKVVIGDYVWLGANVVILPGVSVGDRAIIGANAVVTTDIPANEIWGGVPARYIRSI